MRGDERRWGQFIQGHRKPLALTLSEGGVLEGSEQRRDKL